jgi:hypothetical protein
LDAVVPIGCRGRRRRSVVTACPVLRRVGDTARPVPRGSGLADLAGGKGVESGTQVTEEHLQLMLVALADPISGEPVGGVPKAPTGAAPVAGFDLCF